MEDRPGFKLIGRHVLRRKSESSEAPRRETTIFDLVLPRVLAGEKIGRREFAELGHGGLCMKCGTCTYPVCPFGE